jgi:hypothetical protein
MTESSLRPRDAARAAPARRRRAAIAAAVPALYVLLVTAAGAAEVDQRLWDRLLHRYVDEQGRVSYRDLRAHDKPVLQDYLAQLAGAEPGTTAADAKAFWINAYNAGVIAAVLDGYSAENLLRRHSLFKRFHLQVAGKTRTLDAIEHEILRPTFHDPRVHFALVCASSSCPRLRREAYTGVGIDAALDAEARRFVNDPARNDLDPAHDRAELSAIFSWFADDFRAAAGSIGAFIAPYVDGDDRRALVRAKDGNYTFRDYDWTLNAQDGQRP